MKANFGNYPSGKSNRARKIKVEIERFDTWSLDNTLAYIILPALIQLKQHKMGIPGEFGDVGGESHASQLSFEFYIESHDAAFDEGCKRWEEILDKMIWSFQQIALDDYENIYHHGTLDFDWEKTEDKYPNPITGKMENMYQLVDKNPEEHWYDVVGNRLHDERIQEGLELFGKYYRNLWD